MREAGFRSGMRKPRISGVRHKGDTAVFPCFSAVVKKAFLHKKTAPAGRRKGGYCWGKFCAVGASALRHHGLDPGSSAIKSVIARDSSHGADAPWLDSGSRPE
ncbi:hypothetical protein CFBP6626_06745 [Agrobacterium tumefaciens]|nr:hypothetical protein CFBP6626_06745 [Agrobacterium tumefaciens]